jgi:hypothetical protein
MIVTDCGRVGDERRDCTVRAVAHVKGIPYPEAHALLASVGRRPKRGVVFREVAEKLGFESVPELSGGRLENLLPRIPTGAYIVRKAGHVLAVIDGVIYDTAECSPKSVVKMVYRLKLPSSKSSS